MASSSTRTITIVYTGDVSGTETISAATNTNSPASVTLHALSSGANTITVPTGGTVPTACVIVPPSGSTVALTLKGISGDTGILIHKTDPTTIALDSSVTTFVINAASSVNIRIFWV